MPEPTIFNDHPTPAIAGTFSGPLLVVGTARGVLDDIEAYWGHEGWNSPLHDMMAVNHMGCFLAKMRHWYTAHHEAFNAWKGMRQAVPGFGSLDNVLLHTNHDYPGATRWGIHGSWGLLGGMQAAIVGVALGYSPVVLAGLPADHSGHFYPCGEPGMGDEMFHKAWEKLIPHFAGRVKSLSGKTREIFGAP